MVAPAGRPIAATPGCVSNVRLVSPLHPSLLLFNTRVSTISSSFSKKSHSSTPRYVSLFQPTHKIIVYGSSYREAGYCCSRGSHLFRSKPRKHISISVEKKETTPISCDMASIVEAGGINCAGVNVPAWSRVSSENAFMRTKFSKVGGLLHSVSFLAVSARIKGYSSINQVSCSPRRGSCRLNWSRDDAQWRISVYGSSFFTVAGESKEYGTTPAPGKLRRKGRRREVKKRNLPSPQGAGKVEGTRQAVVVVESPAKAKTIEKYLGTGFTVLASYGHVRDLAARAGSVRPDDDFTMLWEVPTSARPHINAIKAALKGAETLVLASDPDREGEAIAWHMLEMLTIEGVLKKGMKVKRVVFNEITKTAVLRAMEAPRDVSGTLVNAYLARRALDYLIGFDLSPVLWRKLPGSKSAGRVQSAALRLICEREQEMEVFCAQEYWSVEAQLEKSLSSSTGTRVFGARLTHYGGEKLGQFSLSCALEAEAAAKAVADARLHVASVKKSLMRRSPPPPYITSTLQQDASTKLAFGATRTMTDMFWDMKDLGRGGWRQVAQQLYEGVKLANGEQTGLITYMRTDGVQLSEEAVDSIRALAASRYQYRGWWMDAATLTGVLEEDALRLYTLIWARTMASQLEQAILNQVAVDVADDNENVQLRSSGSTVSFSGFFSAYKDPEVLGMKMDLHQEDAKGEDRDTLQYVEAGDLLSLTEVRPSQHFTEPPPRFSEGSLVKKLEELGIGRPSTYASTFRTLQVRNYVRLEKRRIFPETRGRMVSAFLSYYFPHFSDYDFTANMENQLDEVSAGRVDWKTLLGEFWPGFHEGVMAAMKVPIDKVVEMLEEVFAKLLFPSSTSAEEKRVCPSCKEGRVCLKLSRFGSGYFFSCTRYPDCLFKANVVSSVEDDASDDDDSGASSQWSQFARPPKLLGVDPASQLQVVVRVGPYGAYVQLGEASKKQKPRRTTLPKGVKVEEVDLDKALELLSFPRELGKHPEEGTPITIGIGKFGYYLRHRAIIASVPQVVPIEDLTMEKVMELLKGRNVTRRGRRPVTAAAEDAGRAAPSSSDVAKTGRVKTPDSDSHSQLSPGSTAGERQQTKEELSSKKKHKPKTKSKLFTQKAEEGSSVVLLNEPLKVDPTAHRQTVEDQEVHTAQEQSPSMERNPAKKPGRGRGRPRKNPLTSDQLDLLSAEANAR